VTQWRRVIRNAESPPIATANSPLLPLPSPRVIDNNSRIIPNHPFRRFNAIFSDVIRSALLDFIPFAGSLSRKIMR